MSEREEAEKKNCMCLFTHYVIIGQSMERALELIDGWRYMSREGNFNINEIWRYNSFYYE